MLTLDTAKAAAFLTELDRKELARLIEISTASMVEGQGEFGWLEELLSISSHSLVAEALETLEPKDKKRIVEAFTRTHVGVSAVASIEFHTLEIPISQADETLAEIMIHRNQMIAVSTGLRINDVDDYYKARHRRIDQRLKAYRIENPNPHASLWDFYRHWTPAGLASWASRRAYINDLYEPVLLKLAPVQKLPVQERQPTGWERVDRTILKARDLLRAARHEEDHQAIGLLCREAFISAGQELYVPSEHGEVEGVMPSETDATRMIHAFLVASISGSSHEALRRYIKAALQLAVELQHKRTADQRSAALCLEATSSVICALAIISGRTES